MHEDEAVKKLTQQDFSTRRAALMGAMTEAGLASGIGSDSSIAVLFAAQPSIRNRDVEYPYRQNSDFLYLSGFPETEAVLLLIPGRSEGELVVFCRDRDPFQELWHGRRTGIEGVKAEYGADEAFCISRLEELMPELLLGKQRVYLDLEPETSCQQQIMEWAQQAKSKVRGAQPTPVEWVSIHALLHEQRVIKSYSELEVMRAAGVISSQGHTALMRACKPGMHEYELDALFQYTVQRQGCRSTAYSSIVGGGDNSCILHYTDNDHVLNDGDLVLIDAGCELHGYASDITRTFPVNGKFSAEQKALYEIVLEAQLEAIDVARAGNSFQATNEKAVHVVTAGLVDLGLLTGQVDQLIEMEAHREFFMHGTSHWLGLDVHDVGDYKVNGNWRAFEEGMVITVEPGIYIAPDNQRVDERWRGIGIRIEDDIVITGQEPEVITSGVPKRVRDIEQLMQDI